MTNTPLYIAKRYLLAKKGSTAVTFITWLAAFAMMTAVACMFVILSVFSGLEEMNKEIISNLHADLTIYPKNGKILKNIDKIKHTLSKNQDVEAFSKVIEEKVYINYNNIGEIGYLRGVDSTYTSVNPIDKKILIGKYPSFDYTNEVLVEIGLDSRLSIPVDTENDFAWLFMPKSGTGIIGKEEDIFNKKEVYVTGVFTPDNEQLSNYIIAPLELSQQLLNIPKNTAYSIVIKLKNPAQAQEIRHNIQKNLGNDYVIKTKEEENSAFWKMINTEKLMIYLIFTLVIFITTFNLAGAVIILQLDKKQQAKTLLSLGLSLSNLRKIYFNTGVLIVLFGIFSGLIIGSLLCLFQINTGIFMANESLAFPVKITMQNYLIVASITLLLGVSVSWIFSKINKVS